MMLSGYHSSPGRLACEFSHQLMQDLETKSDGAADDDLGTSWQCPIFDPAIDRSRAYREIICDFLFGKRSVSGLWLRMFHVQRRGWRTKDGVDTRRNFE